MQYRGLFDDLEIGDILLVSSTNENLSPLKKWVSSFNYNLQMIGTFQFKKSYKVTHVILSLSKGLFIDSTSERGIGVFTIDELLEDFSKGYSEDFKVIRHKSLADNDLLQESLFKSAEYFYEQSYSYLFMSQHGKKEKAYCSDFISNVYNRIGQKIKDKPIWPIHLFNLLENENWIEVTEVYKDCFEKFKNVKDRNHNLNILGFSLSKLFTDHHQMNDMIRIIQNYTNDFTIKESSFYNVLYPLENTMDKIINESEPDNKDQDFNLLLKPKPMLDELFLIKDNIISLIKEYSENIKLKDEDIKITWKVKYDTKFIQAKTEKKVFELLELLKRTEEINVNFDNQLELLINIYQTSKDLDTKEKIEEHFAEFQKKYPFIKNNVEMERRFNEIFLEFKSIATEIEDDVFIDIIKSYTNSLLLAYKLSNLNLKQLLL